MVMGCTTTPRQALHPNRTRRGRLFWTCPPDPLIVSNSSPPVRLHVSPPPSFLPQVCTNCGTSSTPLWRKEAGLLMCNACGIYFKNHGFHRCAAGLVQIAKPGVRVGWVVGDRAWRWHCG